MIDVKIPTPGESITEVEIASWLVSDGDLVQKDQELAEIESDKATLMLSAPESGRVSIKLQAGETVKVNAVACQIDTSVEVPVPSASPSSEASASAVKVEKKESESKETGQETPKAPEKAEKAPEDTVEATSPPGEEKVVDETYPNVKMTPLAREKMKAAGLSVEEVIKGLKKLTSGNIEALLSAPDGIAEAKGAPAERKEKRTKMSQLRKKLSQRLVKVKNETAMLTTFNEVDMTEVIALRRKYQEAFVQKHGIKLGFMSFFMKASAFALEMRPMVNSMMDDEEIVTPRYADISIAVQTPKGLMVPVIRNVDSLSLPEIETRLNTLAGKARSGKISLEEMTGGTFTITNGGIFGSMLSTPLINPPQSAILGMHNIIERPVAIDGKVEIRPMMYVALSYDHRVIDGKDSVGFLMDVKKMLEQPLLLLSGGRDAVLKLLDI